MQIVSSRSVLRVLYSQSIAVMSLPHAIGRRLHLRARRIVGKTLPAIIGQVAGSVILHRRAQTGIRDHLVLVVEAGGVGSVPTTPAGATGDVAPDVVIVALRVWAILRAPLAGERMRARLGARMRDHQTANLIVLIRTIQRCIVDILRVTHPRAKLIEKGVVVSVVIAEHVRDAHLVNRRRSSYAVE